MSRKTQGSPKRVADAMVRESELRQFCFREGLSLRVMNDAQHWVATDSKQIRVEWWPSTAKAVRGNSPDRFKHKLRVANVDQFMELIEQELEAAFGGKLPEPRVVNMKPNEKPVYPEQPTQTAMPTDWNTARPPRPDKAAHAPLGGELPEQPTLRGVSSEFGLVQTKLPERFGIYEDKPTVTIEASRYAELLAKEKWTSFASALVAFALSAALVAVLFAIAVMANRGQLQ